MFALTLQTTFEAFLLALVTAVAVALVSGAVALLRYSRHMDRDAHALIRWAHRVGRHVGIPFPDDEED